MKHLEPGKQEGRIDVRCEHLLGRVLAGVLADERASAREDRRDRGGRCHGDPVADGRQLPAHLVRVEEASGGSRAYIAPLGKEHELPAVLCSDAGRKQIVVLQLLERGRQFGVPPERIKSRQSESPL